MQMRKGERRAVSDSYGYAVEPLLALNTDWYWQTTLTANDDEPWQSPSSFPRIVVPSSVQSYCVSERSRPLPRLLNRCPIADARRFP